MHSRLVIAAALFFTASFTQLAPVSAAESCPPGQRLERITRRHDKIETKCVVVGPSQSLTSGPSPTQPQVTVTQPSGQKPMTTSVRTDPVPVEQVVVVDGREALDRALNVGFKPGLSAEQHQAVHDRVGLYSSFRVLFFSDGRIDAVTLIRSGAEAIIQARDAYRKEPEVSFADPSWKISTGPIDPCAAGVKGQTSSISITTARIAAGQQVVITSRVKLQEVQFGVTNGVVQVGGTSYPGGNVRVSANGYLFVFVIQAPPGPVMPYVVVDDCGAFKSFIGSGT